MISHPDDTVELGPLIQHLPRFYREYWDDREVGESIWEGFVKLFDEELLQAEQVNASKSIATCPVNFRHLWYYNEMDNWQSYGIQHQHFRKNWRTVSLQDTYYVESSLTQRMPLSI